jgi:hypothetical protein
MKEDERGRKKETQYEVEYENSQELDNTSQIKCGMLWMEGNKKWRMEWCIFRIFKAGTITTTADDG